MDVSMKKVFGLALKAPASKPFFFIAKNPLWPRLRALLEEKGVAVEEDDLLMSCEFRRQGRSIIRINGSAVTRGLLREIGGLLVDVHGQSEHLSLFDKKHHLDYLDAYAHCTDKKVEFGESAWRLYAMQDDLGKLKQAVAERAHRQEILSYQHDEIARGQAQGRRRRSTGAETQSDGIMREAQGAGL